MVWLTFVWLFSEKSAQVRVERAEVPIKDNLVLTYPVYEAGEFFDENLPGHVSITNHYHPQTAPVGTV